MGVDVAAKLRARSSCPSLDLIQRVQAVQAFAAQLRPRPVKRVSNISPSEDEVYRERDASLPVAAEGSVRLQAERREAKSRRWQRHGIVRCCGVGSVWRPCASRWIRPSADDGHVDDRGES